MKHKTQSNQKGFTLVELMIGILIVSILTVMAVMLFTSNVQKGRRADAINTINSIALAEERYRTTNSTYGTLAQVWGGVTTSDGGYYTLAISGTSATGYTITATATGPQVGDTENATACSPLQLVMSNGTITRTPAVCWPQ